MEKGKRWALPSISQHRLRHILPILDRLIRETSRTPSMIWRDTWRNTIDCQHDQSVLQYEWWMYWHVLETLMWIVYPVRRILNPSMFCASVDQQHKNRYSNIRHLLETCLWSSTISLDVSSIRRSQYCFCRCKLGIHYYRGCKTGTNDNQSNLFSEGASVLAAQKATMASTQKPGKLDKRKVLLFWMSRSQRVQTQVSS